MRVRWCTASMASVRPGTAGGRVNREFELLADARAVFEHPRQRRPDRPVAPPVLR